MKISGQTRKKQRRAIYEELFRAPRIYYQDLAEIIGINWKTVKIRLEEAIDLQCILGPELRKRSYENLKEYVYLLNCKDPEFLYLKYRKDPDVIYHAKAIGFCNLWIVAKQKMSSFLGISMKERWS